MNFIDFIILAIVLVTLGLIAYFNFIKKDIVQTNIVFGFLYQCKNAFIC